MLGLKLVEWGEGFGMGSEKKTHGGVPGWFEDRRKKRGL